MDRLVYFIRHGQTDWNLERRLQGQADTALNAAGRDQAGSNGALLARLIPDAAQFDFVASPLARTCQTMRIIRTVLGLEPDGFRTDARLKELHFGDWQGLTFEEVDARSPGSSAARDRDKWNFRPPGPAAESYAILLERVRPWFASLTSPTVCVTHGGVMRVIFRLVQDMPEDRAARIDIPQDCVLRLADTALDWLSPAGTTPPTAPCR